MIKELKRRTLRKQAKALEEQQEKKLLRLKDILFGPQLAFVKDPSYFKRGETSRRAGKTTACVFDLLYTAAIECDGVITLYITLSRRNAKSLVWREAKRINAEFKLGGDVSEGDLSITFPNGSMFYATGARDRTAIENFRGLALKKVYIDECQSFPAYIEELIDDVLEPTLMDYAGSLILTGTPGPVPVGYFYDTRNDENYGQHKWTFWDNPHIAKKSGMSHQALFDRMLKRRGVGPDHPSIQREWFGRWALDLDSLVFQYKSETSHYDSLPQGRPTYIMGVDLGYDDADALSVLAWYEDKRETYLVEEQIKNKQGITPLVEQIEDLRSRYDVSRIVMDTGGLGKKIAEEVTRRYQVPVQSADKARKHEYIELMNDELRTGRLKIKKDSQFAEDAMKVEWDRDKSRPDRRVVSDRFHSDICDSVLYAWRESYGFAQRAQPDRPKPGSPEWQQAEMDRMEEAAEQHFKEQAALEASPFGDLPDFDY